MVENVQKNYFDYAKELIKLALPIIMGHIGFTFIMAGDVLVAGRYSTDVLAAVSISGSVTSLVYMFGLGLIISVSPVLSNRLGAGKSAKKFFYPTLKIAIIVSFITMLLTWACIPLMENLGFEDKLLPYIRIYTFIFGFSAMGGYLYAALKEFLQAYEIVFFPNFIAIIGIFLNILLNVFLVFGCNLGISGLAIASVLVRSFMGLTLLIFCLKNFKLKNIKLPIKYLKVLVNVGIPISIAVTLEMLTFNSMAVIMGRVDGIYAAAQNILNVITSTSFMIPLSISNAIAVKVGYANGARNLVNIKKYGISGVIISVGFMAVCGILFAVFPSFWAEIFTIDKDLINIIVPIMFIIGCFECFDGYQASMGGILKGLKRTQMVSTANLIGYICIGITLGCIFAFKFKMNLYGFWLGIAISSVCVGFILTVELLRIYNVLKKEF